MKNLLLLAFMAILAVLVGACSQAQQEAVSGCAFVTSACTARAASECITSKDVIEKDGTVEKKVEFDKECFVKLSVECAALGSDCMARAGEAKKE